MAVRNIRTIKRQQEKKKTKFAVVLIIIFVCSAAAMFYCIKHFILFGDAVFEGNRHIKNEELRALLKIKKNDSLFATAGTTLHRRLTSSPWVKDAVIRRELSGRTVVRITEAVPFAVLDISDSKYLVDKDGVLLESIREGTAIFLPVIKDIIPSNHREGYAEALKFIKVLNDRKIYGTDVQITGTRPEDITLKIDNILIKIGAGDFEKKLERLELVREEIEKRQIAVEYIDVRFADRIIVKPYKHAEELVVRSRQ
jgi:cell division protein FtsQ